MKKINITQQNKLSFVSGSDTHSIEIGNKAIEAGFLKLLPGATLAIFIFLTTHLRSGNTVLTNPTVIASALPYNISEVKQGLNYLEEHDIINISNNRNGDYSFEIEVYLDKLNFNQNVSSETTDRPKENTSGNNLIIALKQLIPEDKNLELMTEEFKQWIEDFSEPLIRELIRRVNKWLTNNQQSKDKAFYYLQGIVDDWYQKEIFTYKRLQYFDQIYRETSEIAALYGIKWHNINSIQMQTFQSWLTEDFPLSKSVAKFAIKAAIKRKKDGQPSLKYIEDNYIIPFKKARVKNVIEARHFLDKKRQTIKPEKNRTPVKEKNEEWDDFPWQIEKLT